MPRYIDGDALEKESGKLWSEMPDGEELSKELMKAINHAPTVDAVPLDKLCEWLAEHSVIIPCETCRNFSNGYCTAIGDMDKPCPNKAEDWERAIKEWMEGLDDHR